MVHHLSAYNSLVCQYISELRDITVQNDRLRFRRNLERLGEIAAYEISKTLAWTDVEVATPLGLAKAKRLTRQPILATVLRAGLPLHQGLLNYFDKADNAFVGAYRKHASDGSFVIDMGYHTSPSIAGRTLILADPMLATGASLALTLKELMQSERPESIHIVVAIASRQGIDFLLEAIPSATIWAAAIDEKLTPHAYIWPGLGDAGDLAFGSKAQE
ncbi:MAG: uracil phosphoribosyltransferase [Chitinophagales bacterium]|nr:uracil phosphoribosyltransferase [Chitinophagales bacterium]